MIQISLWGGPPSHAQPPRHPSRCGGGALWRLSRQQRQPCAVVVVRTRKRQTKTELCRIERGSPPPPSSPPRARVATTVKRPHHPHARSIHRRLPERAHHTADRRPTAAPPPRPRAPTRSRLSPPAARSSRASPTCSGSTRSCSTRGATPRSCRSCATRRDSSTFVLSHAPPRFFARRRCSSRTAVALRAPPLCFARRRCSSRPRAALFVVVVVAAIVVPRWPLPLARRVRQRDASGGAAGKNKMWCARLPAAQVRAAPRLWRRRHAERPLPHAAAARRAVGEGVWWWWRRV